jgi:hypothetical protein
MGLQNMPMPIQMIFLCNTDGSIRPIRFRFEDEEHHLNTVQVTEIKVMNEIHYAGIEILSCICKAVMGNAEKMFEVRYFVKEHKWVLFDVIY